MSDEKRSIGQLVASLCGAYRDAGYLCDSHLSPPAEKGELAQLEATLGLRVPRELLELYAVVGGQDYFGAGTQGLFGRHRLFSPREVAEQYAMLLDCNLLSPLPHYPPVKGHNGYWVPQLIPFAAWDADSLCVHCSDGRVWDFNPYSGLSCGRPSIAAVLRELIDAVRSGLEPTLIYGE